MAQPLCSRYAETLTGKRVLYMPSCVIVEMMTKLYSDIFACNLSGDLHAVVPDILAHLGRMRENLRVTAETYGEARIRFFVGDWREDKLRMRKVFFNIMSHLGYIAGMVGMEDRELLHGAVEKMTAEWIALDRAMEEKATKKHGHTVCRYFRNRKPDSWKLSMANVILTLDEDADYGEADHLVLICFERIKRLLLATIDGIERRNGTPGKFDPGRILAVSDEEVTFSCPTCLEMTDSIGTQAMDDDYPAAGYADAILGVRGAACRMRPRPKNFKQGLDTAVVEDRRVPKPRGNTIVMLRNLFGFAKK